MAFPLCLQPTATAPENSGAVNHGPEPVSLFRFQNPVHSYPFSLPNFGKIHNG